MQSVWWPVSIHWSVLQGWRYVNYGTYVVSHTYTNYGVMYIIVYNVNYPPPSHHYVASCMYVLVYLHNYAIELTVLCQSTWLVYTYIYIQLFPTIPLLYVYLYIYMSLFYTILQDSYHQYLNTKQEQYTKCRFMARYWLCHIISESHLARCWAVAQFQFTCACVLVSESKYVMISLT